MVTEFSDEHEVALSKIFDAQIFVAASVRSALESMITGTLPAPTPMAGVPLRYALRTLFCEPVTTTRSQASMRAWVRALVTGAGSTCTRSAGRPIFSSSARMCPAVSAVVLDPAGDGARTMALRPLIAIIALLTGVAAGLVDGTTAPTTPTGLAYLTMPRVASSSITPTVLTRSRSRRVPKVLRWFLAVLSATLPSPVSLTAVSARARA